MSRRLYTVTLVDLGTYAVTVAADSEDEAAGIAKTTLLEEAVASAPGMTVKKREVEATAALADQQPLRMFRVHGTYSVSLQLDVPATDRNEAELHAKRLYEHEPFPWEHTGDGGSISWGHVREIAS